MSDPFQNGDGSLNKKQEAFIRETNGGLNRQQNGNLKEADRKSGLPDHLSSQLPRTSSLTVNSIARKIKY